MYKHLFKQMIDFAIALIALSIMWLSSMPVSNRY